MGLELLQGKTVGIFSVDKQNDFEDLEIGTQEVLGD
jgi:hypothetical protein